MQFAINPLISLHKFIKISFGPIILTFVSAIKNLSIIICILILPLIDPLTIEEIN